MTTAQIHALKIKLLSMPSGPKKVALSKLIKNQTRKQK